MTHDELLEMARQAGMVFNQSLSEFSTPLGYGVDIEDLEAFAKLVAAKATDEANARSNTSWTLMCKKMVEDEREACAKEVENALYGQEGCDKAAKAILARGEA